MSKKLKLSVIIPTLRRPDDLSSAVLSILEQNILPEELIIVDQSIDSDSYNKVNEIFIKSKLELRPNLIYIHDTSINGLVAAKNQGVIESSGDIICFLEDDEILSFNYLENVLNAFNSNDQLLGCSGIVSNIRRSFFYEIMFKLFHLGLFLDKRVDVIKYIDPEGRGDLITSSHLSGGISSYRREVFDEIKYDLRNPFFYCEDIEFSIRASNYYGVNRFAIVTNVCLAHFMSNINRDVLEPRWRRKTNEFILLYKKNHKIKYSLICLVWLMIGLLFEAIYASFFHKNIGPIVGFLKGVFTGISHKIIELSNIDEATVDGFGDEWEYFNQSSLMPEEREAIFQDYFGIFPWDTLPNNAVGFDLGCGSGRWASLVADKVSHLNCIDPSQKALNVAKKNLFSKKNVDFLLAGVDSIPIPDNSQDFGYSLGVLHHIPDTSSALKSCIKKLKTGAPFLLYLYYAFDNRSFFYRFLWFGTDIFRRFIHILPEPVKRRLTDLIALFIYFVLARFSLFLEFVGISSSQIPLSYYKDKSFYTMRTDARDRFGTPLEQRFNKEQIKEMMVDSGLTQIQFSDEAPFWCVVGIKKDPSI